MRLPSYIKTEGYEIKNGQAYWNITVNTKSISFFCDLFIWMIKDNISNPTMLILIIMFLPLWYLEKIVFKKEVGNAKT